MTISGKPIFGTATLNTVLDEIGAIDGSILKRGPVNWEILPPGTQDQELAIDAGEPAWESEGVAAAYTDEQAQDAVGTIIDGDDLVYIDATPLLGSRRAVQIPVTDPAGAALSTGDGQGVPFIVDNAWDGKNLTDCWSGVVGAQSTAAGPVTIQLRRVRSGVSADMLSTKITIDDNETFSFTAAVARVIDNTKDDLALGDLIYFDIDVAGTGAKGLVVGLVGDKG